jgi:hypothetical protein
VLENLTPEQAFDMYRGNIEKYEQAMPMLMTDHGGNLGVFEIVNQEVRDGLNRLADEGLCADAVLLSAEAKVLTFDPQGHAHTETPVDCVAISYLDRTGKEWTARRQFMRINGVVTYLEELTVFEGEGEGMVPDGLQRLVGRR